MITGGGVFDKTTLQLTMLLASSVYQLAFSNILIYAILVKTLHKSKSDFGNHNLAAI